MEMIDHFSHPHIHPHEFDMVGYVKQTIASAYTSLLSRIDSHIEDNRVHVTCEEKDYWDNKVDKTLFRDLELRMTEKAEFSDIIELKEQIAKLKANTTDSSEDTDYVTQTEFDDELSAIKNKLSAGYTGVINGARFVNGICVGQN